MPADCRHCGRPLAPDAHFCGECGSPVTRVDAPTMSIRATTPVSGYSVTAPPAPPTWSGGVPPGQYADLPPDIPPRHRAAWAIFGVLVVIASVIAAVVVLRGSNDSTGRTPTTHPTANGQPIVMPVLTAYSKADAISQLTRAGLPAKLITVKTVSRVDVAPGTVVDQAPAAGLTIDTRVLLTVATAPATMPDFTGHGINAARATLSTLDVTIVIDDAIDASVSEGTVLRQVPAAGAPFAHSITLTVSHKPITTKLGDLTPTGDQPIEGESEIAGTTYRGSVLWRMSVCPGSTAVTATYDLGSRYRRFLATAGLGAETVNPADRVHLDIRVDGVVVLSRNLDKPTPVPVDLDVTQHNQIVFTITPLIPGPQECTPTFASLGHARLLAIVGDGT
jgi:hypothetical protein